MEGVALPRGKTANSMSISELCQETLMGCWVDVELMYAECVGLNNAQATWRVAPRTASSSWMSVMLQGFPGAACTRVPCRNDRDTEVGQYHQ